MSYIEEMYENGYDENSINDYEKFIYPYIVKELCNVDNKEAHILDAGGGTGHILLPLVENGFENLSTLDLEDTMKEFFLSKGIHFSTKNLETDTLDYESESFDIIFNKNVIEHLNNPYNMMEEFNRILKVGGKLIIITDDWRKVYKTFYRDPTHRQPYDKESIERLMRMYKFQTIYKNSFLAKYGVGRLKLYKFFPRLAFIGNFMIIVGEKKL